MKWLLSKLGGDKGIWVVVGFLSLISILAVYSSTTTLAFRENAGTEYYLFKQFVFIAIGFFLIYITHLADYRLFAKVSQILFLGSLFLLILTFFMGGTVNDANRWLQLPFVGRTFQPSELAKIGLILYVARTLSRKSELMNDLKRGYLPLLGTIGLTCLLIAPSDLSGSLVLFMTCMIILFVARVNLKFIGATMGAGVVLIGFVILLAFAAPNVGRLGTWKNRISNHFTETTESYQVQQSKIAIVRGGFFGKGPGNSIQKNYLPHPYNDFIYSIIIEEYGLVGGIVVILLFLIFLFRAIRIVITSKGNFGAYLATGLALSLTLQALINMAVAVNIFPVTGITLPLVSMGGTSLWMTCIAVGVLLSVSRHNDKKESDELAEGEGTEELNEQKAA